ncbi:MAG: hypothetical protein AB8C84_01030 [Oligoflexales bacterium]
MIFTRIMAFVFLLLSCGSPEKEFEKQLKKLGYIPYSTPLQHAGTGTLVGGQPSRLSLVAPPESCFPRFDNDDAGKLRRDDPTILPEIMREVNIGASAKADFFAQLAAGMPSIRAGFHSKSIKKIHLRFEGARVEYFDSLRLTEFYRNGMTDLCKDYLERVGFMIQALRVEKMIFTFYKKKTGKVNLDVEGIESFLDIGSNVDWRIEEGSSLIITTPKYIGYQLGRLRRKDNGFVFKRSTRIKKDKFVWKKERIFNPGFKTFQSYFDYEPSGEERFYFPIEETLKIR